MNERTDWSRRKEIERKQKEQKDRNDERQAKRARRRGGNKAVTSTAEVVVIATATESR